MNTNIQNIIASLVYKKYKPSSDIKVSIKNGILSNLLSNIHLKIIDIHHLQFSVYYNPNKAIENNIKNSFIKNLF